MHAQQLLQFTPSPLDVGISWTGMALCALFCMCIFCCCRERLTRCCCGKKPVGRSAPPPEKHSLIVHNTATPSSVPCGRVEQFEEEVSMQPPSYPQTRRGSNTSLALQVKNRAREAALDAIASLLTRSGLPPRHTDGSLQARRGTDTLYPRLPAAGTSDDPITVI
jgi:hypothetical protein